MALPIDSSPHGVLERLIGAPPFIGARPDTNNSAIVAELRRWAITQGVPESAALGDPSYKLAAAYANRDYCTKWAKGASRDAWRKKPRSNLSGLSDEEDEQQTSAPIPASMPALDSLAIAQVADAVIAPRIESAKRELERGLTERINSAARAEAERIGIGERAKQTVRELAAQAAREAIADALPPRRIEIVNTDGTIVNIGHQHEMFPTLLKLVGARGHNGQRLNIWLTGPTGSGKTTAAEKVAEALAPTFTNYRRSAQGKWELFVDGQILDLGLEHSGPFGADSSLDADYKLTGHKNAQGEFQWTTFLRIFAYGGVYVMDEIDNWMPSALVAANAPLANGWISTPHGMIQRHPDCCIIACANTWGTGPTNDYVGRAKLDAATLNRFPNKLNWPIDEKLERSIAREMGGENWCDIVQAARAAAKAQGLQVIFSPRNTFEGIAALRAGFTVREVVEMNLFAGLKPEQIAALGLDSITTTKAVNFRALEAAQ